MILLYLQNQWINIIRLKNYFDKRTRLMLAIYGIVKYLVDVMAI